MKKALCVISGGMDSTLCGYIAKHEEKYEVVALHFNYGQRTEKKELECFRNICNSLDVKESVELDAHFIKQIGGSSLVDENIQIPTDGLSDNLPSTYVPFRNGIFLSIAAAVAERYSCEAIFLGVVEEDSSGYPDCSEKFISAMEEAINNGTSLSYRLQLKTPLVHLSKMDIVKKSLELNVPLHLTWSCYKDDDVACGVCDSCRLRLRGFEKANKNDLIRYVKR